MAKVCIGIDLGGTNIKLAAMTAENEVSGVMSAPTPRAGGDAVIEAMAIAARDLMSDNGLRESDVIGVGVGSPGPLRRSDGVVVGAPNLPGFANMPLRDKLSRKLGMSVVLENDANAAAYGEFIAGVGRDAASLVLLTLGTGVGGGIVLDGRIWHGHNDFGGEIGHMIVHPGGLACGCGQHGCLEQYASATNLARRAADQVKAGRQSVLEQVLMRKGELSAADVGAARRSGDALACEVWDAAAYHLAVACVTIERIFDCEQIVLGGGLANAGDDLLTPVQKHYTALDWKLTPQMSKLVLAELGNDAGVIGAAGVAWQQLGRAESQGGGF